MGFVARFRAAGLPRTAWVLAITAFLVAVGFGVVIRPEPLRTHLRSG